MKQLLILSYTLLLSFLYLPSCDNSLEAEVTINYTDCGIICNYLKVDSTFAITEACAKCLVSNFRENGYNFPDENANPQKKVKGFEMRNAEIVDFFKYIQRDSSSFSNETTIFGIFGIYHGQVSKDSKEIVTSSHQFFEVQLASTMKVGEYEYTYYNFIQPCPEFCPNNYPALVGGVPQVSSE